MSQNNKKSPNQQEKNESIEDNFNKYTSDKKMISPQDSKEIERNIKETKKELEKLKSFILKKYSFTEAIGILPPKSLKMFIDEELGDSISEEKMKKLQKKTHLCIIIPDEKEKEMSKIKQEIIKKIEKSNQEIWIYVKTPSEIWEIGLDSKFDLLEAIGMSFPLYDKGILQVLRVSSIHKSLVLQKFEKYVVSYVVAGSLVRGDALKTSDADAFIIINDTDVKKMSRLELKERLRGIIYQYVSEAHAIAGAKKNLLHVQIYLLTDFWESVKDAHPVIFTFIRDGVPLYDRGTFMPWKVLLKMGKLKPSPESIDMFMSIGDKTIKRAKSGLMDILIRELYPGVITPSQALLMLYGRPPPTPQQTVKEMKEIFVNKEKMLEPKYLKILEEVVKKFKESEHEKLKEIKGQKIDNLINDAEDYLNRLKDLRKQIEKRAEEKTIEEINKTVFDLLKAITGKKSQASSISEFEKMVKKGKFTTQHLKIIRNISDAKKESKKGKSNLHKIDKIRKSSTTLINDLIEYSQRKDLIPLEKSRMILKYFENGKEKNAEIILCENKIFLFKQGKILKIEDNIKNSTMEEVSNEMRKQKSKKEIKIDSNSLELLKKELGEFEILI